MKAGARAAATALATAREQNTTMQHEKTACHVVGFTTSKAGLLAWRMRRTRLNELKQGRHGYLLNGESFFDAIFIIERGQLPHAL